MVYMPEPTTSSSQEFHNTVGKGEHPLKKRAETDFCENPFRYLRWTLKMFVTQSSLGLLFLEEFVTRFCDLRAELLKDSVICHLCLILFNVYKT